YVLAIADATNPKTYLLDADTYTVGRIETCNVCIDNQFVSRQHAYLQRVPVPSGSPEFTYVLVEGNPRGTISTNGVFVNGERVTKRSLVSGDVIHFGPEVKAYFFLVAPRTGRTESLQGKVTLLSDQTAQTQLAIHFDAMLDRLSQSVRDTLDEQNIMQTAVQELALVLDVPCCNAGVYDFEQRCSSINYEYASEAAPSRRGVVTQFSDAADIYNQLLDRLSFQSCPLTADLRTVQPPQTHLAFPIADDSGVMGDLWLTRHADLTFSDRDIRLVERVATQCAIAMRQARLFRDGQTQLKELQRLNQLADNFISTVSHELRTPLTNMKMAMQMLRVSLGKELSLPREMHDPKTERGRIAQYFQILDEECEREIDIINDLLDLQQMYEQVSPQTEA
ncbi:MAG: FHA domain-containing protein, partial [Cyanobacteria bacterium J06639_1]